LHKLWSVVLENRCAHSHFVEVDGLIPLNLLESSGHPVTGQSDALSLWPMGAAWDWPGESWLEELRAGGVEEKHLSSAIKYVEVQQMRSLIEKSDRQTQDELSEWPTEAVRTLMGEIIAERGRQLAAMTDAMGRFIEAVFDS